MKNAYFYLLLLGLVLVGDRGGAYLLQNQVDTSQFRYSRLYQSRANADILLLGNSRGLVFYQPEIEALTRKTAFNLSYNGLPMDAACALVLDYLDRHPAPKMLLIDITLCDRENDALLAGFLPYTPNSNRLATLIRQKQPGVWRGAWVSGLYRFNNELFQRALFYRKRPDQDWLLDRVILPELAVKAPTESYDLELHPYLIQQLQATIAGAHAKGTVVKLVVNPYFPGFVVKNLDPLIAEVESKTGLKVHDYRNFLTEPQLFGDFMHPNKQGSVLYLKRLQQDGVLRP